MSQDLLQRGKQVLNNPILTSVKLDEGSFHAVYRVQKREAKSGCTLQFAEKRARDLSGNSSSAKASAYSALLLQLKRRQQIGPELSPGLVTMVGISTEFKSLVMFYYPNTLASLHADYLVKVIKPLLKQLTQGLQAIHLAGFCHNDIKPKNIFISYCQSKLDAVLGDFGSMRKQGHYAPQTLAYQAPELIKSAGKSTSKLIKEVKEVKRAKPSPKTDIYSLGKSLITCLEPVKERIISQEQQQQDIYQLIQKMCHDNPDERPGCLAILEALKDV